MPGLTLAAPLTPPGPPPSLKRKRSLPRQLSSYLQDLWEGEREDSIWYTLPHPHPVSTNWPSSLSCLPSTCQSLSNRTS